MNKRFLSLGLAAALTMGLSVPAFATSTGVDAEADPTTGVYSSEVEITGTTQAPTIKVNVPTTGAVVINPYKMEYTPSGSSDKFADQIISATQYIANTSDVAISISAKATGEVAGDAVLGTAAPAATIATKTAYLYLEMVKADDNTSDPTWATRFDAKTMAVVGAGTKAVVVKDICKLEATDGTTANYAAFRLNGSVAPNPTKPWTTDDTVTVALAFTFTPVVGTGVVS